MNTTARNKSSNASTDNLLSAIEVLSKNPKYIRQNGIDIRVFTPAQIDQAKSIANSSGASTEGDAAPHAVNFETGKTPSYTIKDASKLLGITPNQLKKYLDNNTFSLDRKMISNESDYQSDIDRSSISRNSRTNLIDEVISIILRSDMGPRDLFNAVEARIKGFNTREENEKKIDIVHNDDSLADQFSCAADPKEIGIMLAAARKAAGLTQQDIADATGLSRRVIGRIEKGQTNTTVETIALIADAVDLTPKFQLVPKAFE